MPTVRIDSQTPTSLILRDLIAPNTLTEFHYVWLRDNCPCPLCLHPTNQQKLHNSFQVPVDIKPVFVGLEQEGGGQGGWRLRLRWDVPLEPLHLSEDEYRAGHGHGIATQQRKEDHETIYSLKRLVEGAYATVNVTDGGTKQMLPAANSKHTFVPQVWDQKKLVQSPDLFMDFSEICPSSLVGAAPSFHEIVKSRDQGLYRFLKQLSDYGLVIIRNMPFEELKGEFGQPVLAIERVAERIGPILETFYGRTWDVQSVENSNNIAYTNVELGLHTDLCYMEKPPGLQFLHCLIQSDTGGENYFSDAYRAVERLRDSYTDGESDLEILSRIPVTFHYNAPTSTHRLKHTHPTISRSKDLFNNEVYEVTYSPPFQGPMEFAEIKDPRDVTKFYSAFKKFARLLEEPGASWEYRMRPGEMVVFSNRRVLHARKAFNNEAPKMNEKGGNGQVVKNADGSVVTRHLKGTYVQWDAFRDRLRGMTAVFEGTGQVPAAKM